MPLRSGSTLRVGQRERPAAQRARDPADVQAAGARDQRRAADREVVAVVEVRRPFVADRGCRSLPHLEVARPARRCRTMLPVALAERVRHLQAVVVAEALLQLRHQRVVVGLAVVHELDHVGRERREAGILLRAAAAVAVDQLGLRHARQRRLRDHRVDADLRVVIELHRTCRGRASARSRRSPTAAAPSWRS